MLTVLSPIIEFFSSVLLTSTMVTAGLLLSILSLIGTFWFVLISLELIPQKIRHWLIFPVALSLGIGIPYFMLFSGYIEFFSLAFTDSPTPLPIIVIFGMIASIVMGTVATTILGFNRSLYTIDWLEKSFTNKSLPHSDTPSARYSINMIYVSVALALFSSLGILFSDIQVSSSFFFNYTLLYSIGGGLTYLFSKQIQQPREMIALPSLANGSPFFGIALWGLSKIFSVIGCIVFLMGILLLPRTLQFETWFGMIFGLGTDIFLLSVGLICLQLGNNKGILRRLRLGIEKSNILTQNYLPTEKEEKFVIDNTTDDIRTLDEELYLKKEDLEFLNRDV